MIQIRVNRRRPHLRLPVIKMGKNPLCWLLIAAHLVAEIPSVLYLHFYSWSSVPVNWILHFQYPMARFWNIRFVCEDFLFVVVFFSMAWSVKHPDNKLFFVGSVFTFYHFIDSLLFWYDFKTSYFTYWLLLLTLVTCIVKILNFRFKLKVVK